MRNGRPFALDLQILLASLMHYLVVWGCWRASGSSSACPEFIFVDRFGSFISKEWHGKASKMRRAKGSWEFCFRALAL